ncbi:glutaredoxin family protein [Enterovibrio norvegicus]|uniref:GST N-terminal domain-containing protein n=1 Tax=Enterovibrio norvegicus TaxID=188144 RepID=A0A2N7L4J9_9GAMM|nr:glutathione S-transferase N-terminal domain-containing protein [Enterovibrio norvegicus]PMN65555.1 hypothetical protein BCT27_09065 [Enterovibrio norvegicus]PMN88275.1 hypothetical protein BCT23_07580 [Enterovibrio norvegicus]
MSNLELLSLYHKDYCPYCLKVRAAMTYMGVDIKLVNVGTDSDARDRLISEGGKSMVPCLRIESTDGSVEWMYESDDIIEYLKENVAS